MMSWPLSFQTFVCVFVVHVSWATHLHGHVCISSLLTTEASKVSTLKTPFYNRDSSYSDHKCLSPLITELIKDRESIISVSLPYNPPGQSFILTLVSS